MAVSQPISGAKVGDSAAVGTPSVANQRQGVFPTSVPLSWVVSSALQVRDAASLAHVKFNLVALPVDSTNLDFGGAQNLFPHARATSTLWGTTSVANKAQTLRPAWVYTGKVAWPTLAYSARYAKYALALADPVPHGYHFRFGGAQLLYAHGKLNAQAWGATVLKQPLPIRPTGFLTNANRFGGTAVLRKAKVDEFNLVLAAARTTGTNLPFGTIRTLLTHARSASTLWGGTAVRNKAQDIRPTGIYTSTFPLPVLSRYKGAWVAFAFDQGYSHPHTANLGFYFAGGKQINATSWDSSVFGTARTYLHLQPVRPTGCAPTLAFGTAFLDHFAAKIKPAGWVDDVFGSPRLPAVLKPHAWDNLIFQNFTTVKNFFQYIRVYPFTGQPITPPSPKVYNLLQFLRPTGADTVFAGGLPQVSNYYRWMYVPGLAVVHTFGTTKVNLGRRYITYVYLPGTQTSFGSPFIAWCNRTISPNGLASTLYGTATVRGKAQRCYPVGRASTLLFGVPQVRERTQRCYPFALDSNLYGTGFVYLYTQQIKPPSLLQWDFDKDRFGYYSNVYTKNKKITTNGYDSSRFSMGGLVYNGARRISVWATIPMTRYGKAFAAYRVRSFGVEWYTQEVFGTPYVRTRQVISLDGWGWRSTKFGIPSRVWSNMQFIKPFSTYEQTGYGRQWVSYGLRDLRPSAILTQPAGTPFVSYNPRYIKPAGIQHGYVGTLHLETHQNIIKLWGYLNEGYGEPRIYNNTPEIHVYGAITYLPGGAPSVSLMRRYLHVPQGQDSAIVGDPFISYRTRKIRTPSPDYLRWGNALVQFDQSQLAPPQQKIVPDSIQGGAGVVPNWEWGYSEAPFSGQTIPLGRPYIRLNTIYPDSLGTVDKFGELFTRSMAIMCDPGPSTTEIGTPTLSGGTKWITLPTSNGEGDTKFGTTHVVGDQYIDCGRAWDATTSTWRANNYHTYGNEDANWFVWWAQTVGPTFGARTTVTNHHRRIYINSHYMDYQGFAVYGRPRISTRPQYIRPAGVLAYKRGLPDVSHAGMKPLYAFSWEDNAFGSAELHVQEYGPKWLYPAGFREEDFGVTRVELKHRRVYPSGVYGFTSPRGAQYVGPYLRIYADPGLDHSEFGTLYIDYRHRRVYQLDVTDDMEPWQTSKAVRVKHQARGYYIEGSNFRVQFGVADVGNRVKRVRPTGWEEFETGFSYVPTSYPGLSKLKAQAFIMQPYTSTMEFGNGTVAFG